MRNSLILIVLFNLLLSLAFAQNITEEDDEKINTKTLAFGATTSNYTSLIGGLIARSSTPFVSKNNKTAYRYIALELLNLRNPREYNQFNGFGPKYVYGKRNYLFTLRPQYGQEYTLFEKNKDSNIGMSLIVAGGPSIGLLKPYYVRYKDYNSFIQFDPNIHSDIVGVGGLLKNGIKGIKFTPGLHAKSAINIDINTFNDNVSGLEIGTTVEFFFKKPEILATSLSENPQTFISVFLTLYFGNKSVIKPKKKSGSGID